MINWFSKDNFFIVLGIASLVFIICLSLIRIFSKKTGSWEMKITDPAPVESKRADSQGEMRARMFLEKYFGRAFPKARPNFLCNAVSGGHNLELDCFNADLKLAVEYNGQQHYKYIPYFHKSKEAFMNQKYRDELKRIYCRNNGITLIEVPYTELGNLENWLRKKLSEVNK